MSHDPESRLRVLSGELLDLRARLRMGGGEEKIRRQHDQGKLTARERVDLLLDPGEPWVEIGLLVAHDRYDGQAPGAGVVTGVGVVEGREAVVVANDATVKAGSWWPETIQKILRAQEIAMRCRIPIVYLVDSAGVNLPYQSGVFPGQYGAARIFYYNSVMRRYLGVPQLSAVMGPCIAGGAYLPALSDVIVMVEGTSFMGLGGPNLVKGATGQEVDAEELGGARVHTEVSGVAHYLAKDDTACVEMLRRLLRDLAPGVSGAEASSPGARAAARSDAAARRARRTRPDPDAPATEDRAGPVRDPSELYDLLPHDHRQAYDVHAVLECILDAGGAESAGGLDEFQPDHAREMICGTGRLAGMSVAVIANARGLVRDQRPGPSRFGGIVYPESAEKVAYFIETMSRRGLPLLFVQDVSGFMVGPDAERAGIIRAGARFVEAMATATVPKLVLTLNHASGAGYYAMAGQGFDPDFILSLPTGRMGVMEGDSAVMALSGSRRSERRRSDGEEAGDGMDDDASVDRSEEEERRTRMDEVREEYERQLDARFAAARGFVDEVVLPEELRSALTLLLRASLSNPGPHLGPFTLPFGEGGPRGRGNA